MSDPNAEDEATTHHVDRARRGDVASTAWLVERFTPLLLEQARWRLGAALRRRVEPEDLVQETWAVALPALVGFGERGGPADRRTPKLVRFLSTTLLYRLNDHARRAARTAGLADEEAVDGERDELAALVTGTVTRAGQGEARSALAAALDELSERDRSVVVLRALEQHPNGKVAELLGESPNAVSLRYNRALERLRRRLGPSILDELDGKDANA